MTRLPAPRALILGLVLGLGLGCRTSAAPSKVLDARSFAYAVAFLPGSRIGCALLEQGEHRLVSFDRVTGRRLGQLRLGDGQDELSQMALSPSGRLLAVAFRELRVPGASAPAGVRSRTEAMVPAGSVLFVDVQNGRVQCRVSVPSPVLSVAFVDEDRLALGTAATRWQSDRRTTSKPTGRTAAVCLLRPTGQWIGCLAEHRDGVTALASLGGGRLASGSWDGTLRLWDAQLQVLDLLEVGVPINALVSMPRASAGPLLAVATSRVPPRRSRALTDLEARGGHRGSIHPDDRIELWSLTARKRLRVLQPHRSYVTRLAASPDGQLLASGSWDFSVWLERAGRPAQYLDRFSQIITGLALSPEGDALAVAAWTEQGSGAPSCLLVANSSPGH